MKLKFKYLVVICMLIIFSHSISFAEKAEGKTIRLESYSGSVVVLTGAGKELNLMNKMRIFDGYTIITSADSSAYLSIDNMKSIRLDQNTKVSIVKKDKVNEIQVVSGSIFFSVKEKLKDDESLDVVTPTMAIGIRGTTGTVLVKKEESRAQIYSGKVVARNNRGKERDINPGHEVRESEHKEKELEVVKLDIAGQDIPSFSLNEINKDVEIKKQIVEEKVFEIEKFVTAEKINKEKEEKEIKEELKEIEDKKEEAEIQKTESVIEITEIVPTVIQEEVIEIKELECEYEVLNDGENVEIKNSEGNLYIFEINEETGTAELKQVIDYSGDIKIGNSDSINITKNENENINVGGQDYDGAYKVIE